MWYIFFVQYKPTTFNLISSFLDRTMFGNLHKVDTFKKSKRKTRIVGARVYDVIKPMIYTLKGMIEK